MATCKATAVVALRAKSFNRFLLSISSAPTGKKDVSYCYKLRTENLQRALSV